MAHETGERIDAEAGGESPAFGYFGPADPQWPVLISVPHAGRHYPDSVLARSAVPLATLARLEDRHADALVMGLEEQGYGIVCARVARAVIDLNRDPRDIDRRMIAALPHGQALIETAKSRGGLGLFPRSLPRIGGLWRAPMPWAEAHARIEAIHAPYHAELERRLRMIRAVHGQALLLDVHSMPPLEPDRFAGALRPDVVIGDRFGASAASRFAEVAREVVLRHGLKAAVNHPYPGTYIAERHGKPAAGRHVVQIEISRDLYLDAALREPGAGLNALRAMLLDLAESLREEINRAAPPAALPIAAE